MSHKHSHEKHRDRSPKYGEPKSKFCKPRFDSDTDSDQETRKPSSQEQSRSFKSHTRSSRGERPSWKKKNDEHHKTIRSTDEGDLQSMISRETETRLCPDKLFTPDKRNDSPKRQESAVPVNDDKILTPEEMNALGAKIIKAELMGNLRLAEELKGRLDRARLNGGASGCSTNRQISQTPSNLHHENKRLQSNHFSRDFLGSEASGSRSVPKHDNSFITSKFCTSTVDEQKGKEKKYGLTDYKTMKQNMSDEAIEAATTKEDRKSKRREEKEKRKQQDRERHIAVKERKMNVKLDNCSHCLDNTSAVKHLIIAVGFKVYLCLPPHQSITTGHCWIVPMHHVSAITHVDEDVFSEIQIFRKGLTKMFERLDMDCVFFESSMRFKHCPHAFIECVPLPTDVGNTAPMYFKKALLESETEWSQNKKIIELPANKMISTAVPKELPYFSVYFGLDNGYAHVIEDEDSFSKTFAQEIIAGMLDLDHALYRKPRNDPFAQQTKKAVEFSEMWKPYDWTQRIKEDST